MSQATHVYRNKKNGRLGEMTEDQAAIWPDLLELAVDEPVEESNDSTQAPVVVLTDPIVVPTSGGKPEAKTPTTTTKKKD